MGVGIEACRMDDLGFIVGAVGVGSCREVIYRQG